MVKEYARRAALVLVLSLVGTLACGQVIVTPSNGVAVIDIGTCGQGGASPNPSCTFKMTLTANVTVSFNNVFGGANVNLFINPATFAVTWPASVTPTPTLTASQNNLVSLRYDGSSNTWTGIGGGGGVGPNLPLPAATSGPGPVFNVKNYGAVGNMRNSVNASINGSTITCSDCNFTAADNGKPSFFSRVWTTVWSNLPLTVVNSTTATITSSFAANSGILSWGTIDDTAVSNATTAFLAACQQQFDGGVLGITAAAPILYFPTGNYGLLNTAIFLNPATSCAGLAIKGDGSYQSRITALTGYVPTRLLVMANLSSVTVQGVTFDGMTGSGASQTAIDTSSSTTFNDVVISSFGNNGLRVASTGLHMVDVLIVGNNGTGFQCTPCSGMIEHTTWSNNNNANIFVSNSTGLPGDFGIKFVADNMDECASPPCMQITNSQDVWLVGSSWFGTAGSSGIQVDGRSSVHINGGIVGPFAQDNNGTALTILTGGVVEASDVRFVSTGTGKCINNSGTFLNNGANTCESMFNAITAASSSGTTATLTVTTQGANVSAVCAVNDSVFVQNVGVAGYNGFFKNKVTAVGTNTLSYTTPGSNLGASSGGSVFCRGYTTYTGTLPYSTITPTPNTCYVTGTFGAITLCNQFIDRGINIYHIKASSGVTTACTVAPVVTISDGTNSATLTITTAKATWDSSVDASTNVGTLVFTPDGGTLTVTTTAGTCTTPPTNFALTYTMQGVLDN